MFDYKNKIIPEREREGARGARPQSGLGSSKHVVIDLVYTFEFLFISSRCMFTIVSLRGTNYYNL